MFFWFEKMREKRAQEMRAAQKRRIAKLLDILRQVPAGRALMDFSDERGLRISFSDRLEGRNAAYRRGRSVLLSTRSKQTLQPLFLAHEIRHAWQDHNGLLLQRMINIDDAIVNQRFTEADCFSLEPQLAWELEQADIVKGIWKAYKKDQRTLAQAFENAAKAGPRAIKNGTARRAVFNEWFRTAYKNDYDTDTINNCRRQCENVAQGRRAYVASEKRRAADAPPRMSVGYLREFGMASGSKNYLENANTHCDFYTGRLSSANRRRLEKLCAQYDFVQTDGVAGNILAPR